MTVLGRMVRRALAVFQSGRMRHELDEEMAFHLDALTEDLVRQGMSPRDARREAVRRFGSPEAVHTRSREERGVAFFDEGLRNVRFAVRSLSRSPLFAATFVVTLALCVASGTAVFSVADAVLLRSLPYPDAERLAHAVVYDPAFGLRPGNTAVDGRTWERLRDEGEPFERAVYSAWARGVNLSTDESAAYVQQQRVGQQYFATLGVAMGMGREFNASEDVPGGPPVAVISHELWQSTFGADPEILGRTIRLKGEAHAVVGVLPAGFRTQAEADVYTPLRPSSTGEGSGTNYAALVRIPEGMSFAEAQARLGGIEARDLRSGDAEYRLGLVPLDEALNAGMRMPVAVLIAGAIVMLLVGVFNLAGLQIARALSRRTELATRHALGGGRSALARQVITENVLLGVLGGFLGVAVASTLTGGLGAVLEQSFGLWQDVGVDSRALGIAALLTLCMTLAFGIAPVGQVMGRGISGTLRSGGRTLGGGAHRLRRALIVGQVALVTTMLFAAGMLLRSYDYLTTLEPGFEPDGVFTVQLSLDDARFAEADRVRALFDESVAIIEALPTVASAAVALTLPYERALNLPYRIPGEDDNRLANAVYVTPDFFETLSIPLRTGRLFGPGDRDDAPVVAVVNEAFAEAGFGVTDVVGRGIEMNFGRERDITVVGVVGNVQQTAGWGGNGQPVWETPTIYLPVAQANADFLSGIHIWFAPSWVVRAATPGAQVGPEVTRVLLDAAPDMPAARAASLERIMADAFAGQRFEAAFLLTIALFALLLAGVGLYGIVAHEVLERRSEMGLRMALGAKPGQAVWSAGASGLRLSLAGIALGGVFSVAVSGTVRSLVFGVGAFDPIVTVGLILVLAALSVSASFIPAGRLGRLDPAIVLRDA
jgi:predicted permease